MLPVRITASHPVRDVPWYLRALVFVRRAIRSVSYAEVADSSHTYFVSIVPVPFPPYLQALADEIDADYKRLMDDARAIREEAYRIVRSATLNGR